MSLVFDIGMFDGADTKYYLECGYCVVAVEANYEWIGMARSSFKSEIANGRLALVNAAITFDGGPANLAVSMLDAGSNTVFPERIAEKIPHGTFSVAGTTLTDLIGEYGVPYYLKVDIEGADRFCIMQLRESQRPKFVSFEIGDDYVELTKHLSSIGYCRFRIINQYTFRDITRQSIAWDRFALRLMRYMGYGEPRLIRRNGRFFVSGHSSGPMPDQLRESWYSREDALLRYDTAKANNKLWGWYDIHASY